MRVKAMFGLACGLLLSGCGIAARVDARQEYRASVAAYKECLAKNATNPRACDGLRLAMEADEREYNNLSAGIQGAQSSHNITVLQR